MSEPLSEVSENSWVEFLDRFDTEIYPVLFEKRGYTKAEALIAWTLSKVEGSVDDLRQELEDKWR